MFSVVEKSCTLLHISGVIWLALLYRKSRGIGHLQSIFKSSWNVWKSTESLQLSNFSSKFIFYLFSQLDWNNKWNDKPHNDVGVAMEEHRSGMPVFLVLAAIIDPAFVPAVAMSAAVPVAAMVVCGAVEVDDDDPPVPVLQKVSKVLPVDPAAKSSSNAIFTSRPRHNKNTRPRRTVKLRPRVVLPI